MLEIGRIKPVDDKHDSGTRWERIRASVDLDGSVGEAMLFYNGHI
jgi:hypothetical protein